MFNHVSRRQVIGSLSSVAAAVSTLALGQVSLAQPAKIIRIGFQKFNTLNILKARGSLDKRLQPLGIAVQWNEFSAGPQLLEALNAGSIDFGHAADTPPIGAQSSGVPLLYVACEPPFPKGVAVIVKADSPIQTLNDLRGKKVAIGKGWNVFNMLVRGLEKQGLKLSDIQPAFVTTAADAVAAFEGGSVDAFGTWDPFYAVSQRKTGGRVLLNGSGIVDNRTFYFSSRDFFPANQETLRVVLQEVQKVNTWANADPRNVAEFLSPQLGIEVQDLETATRRRVYGVQAISPSVITEQQRIADTFFRLKLIPKAIQIKDAVAPTNLVG